MTNSKDYKFVYRKDYAKELIAQGHKVFATMPNPANNKLMMWAFVNDATFENDFEALKGGDGRND
jgi:hypothetical protein